MIGEINGLSSVENVVLFYLKHVLFMHCENFRFHTNLKASYLLDLIYLETDQRPTYHKLPVSKSFGFTEG